MTVLTDPPDPLSAFKTLWGASQPPFAEAVQRPYESKSFSRFSRQLQQLVAVRACGLVYGPHGVGKTLLVQHLLASLPDKRYKPLLLSHSSVTTTQAGKLRAVDDRVLNEADFVPGSAPQR